jgi:APA family basic amino acid/polyamine antiporter
VVEPAPTVIEPQAVQKGKLLRLLGVGFGIAVTVGGMVGVGILRTPGMVAAQLGDSWLIIAVWVLGGVYALLGTITVTELGAMLPQAGGWYVYARRAFGEYGGFAVGWCDWLGQTAALAYLGTSIGDFAATLIPTFSSYTKLIAIATLFFFALLQWRGLRLSSQTQEATSFVKALAYLALVGACFIFGGKSPAADGTHAALPTAPGLLIALVIALQSVVVTYDGWYSAIYFTEEDRDPARNLPRSAIGGVLATIVIYLLVNVALIYALPLDRLAASPLPAADAAQTIFGAYSGQAVTALSLVSLLSIINAVLLLGTRVLFAISRDHLFWSRAAVVNAGGTPSMAMLLTTLAGALLIASGTFETLIAMAAFFYAVIYLAGFVSLFVLRAREPGLPRPFRAWGHPWTTSVALIGSVLFLVGTLRSDTTNSLQALVLIGLSFPAYLIAVRMRK